MFSVKRKMEPSTILLIGGIITVLVSWYATRRQEISDKEDKDNLNSRNQELLKKNDELTRITTNTLNSVTGKDSYCYVKIVIPLNSTKAKVYLTHSGEYVVRNIRVSLVNTDEEAGKKWDEPVSYDDTYAKKYYKVDHPYIETVPVLLPNQILRLRDIGIVPGNYNSFNIAYTADNDFWFQRTLLRNAEVYGAQPGQGIRDYVGYTTIYKLNLDPKLNQAHRHEIVKKKGALGGPYGGRPSPILFSDGTPMEFPFNSKELFREFGNWYFLHWNGNYLERAHISLPVDDLDSPLRY